MSRATKALLSDEHFSVDGSLIEAWASLKSFKPKDAAEDEPPESGGEHNRERDFHGETRSNATHASTTDPDARLFRKGRGKEARLCYMGHLLVENRHGLIVGATLTPATGTAEARRRWPCSAVSLAWPSPTIGSSSRSSCHTATLREWT